VRNGFVRPEPHVVASLGIEGRSMAEKVIWKHDQPLVIAGVSWEEFRLARVLLNALTPC
jgi:hypothetical protein